MTDLEREGLRKFHSELLRTREMLQQKLKRYLDCIVDRGFECQRALEEGKTREIYGFAGNAGDVNDVNGRLSAIEQAIQLFKDYAHDYFPEVKA